MTFAVRDAFSRATLAVIAIGLIAAPGAAAETYFAELGNDPTAQWVGVASVHAAAPGTLDGELCLVRKEYIDHPALDRSIVRVPISGVRTEAEFRLRVQPVANGPNFIGNEVRLHPNPNWDDEPELSFEWWEFGSEEGFWNEDGGPIRSAVTRQASLKRGPNLWRETSSLSGPDYTRVAFYATRQAQEEDIATYYSLDVYDRMSPIQAIKFEKPKIYQDLFDVGHVNIYAETGNLAALKKLLDGMGHGARILNGELAACPSAPLLTMVTVPPGLELWYTRRLQTSGLVIAARPEVLGRDPAWSGAFPVASAAVVAALRNSRLDTAGKYRAIWSNLEAGLKQFAQARRSNYLSSGSVTALNTGADFMFRAELSGKALAVCDRDRWEKITVNATVNSFDAERGRADMALNFSDGFAAKGKKPPGDSRWRDNRIPDSDLGRLQDLFLAFLKGNRTSTAKCTT